MFTGSQERSWAGRNEERKGGKRGKEERKRREEKKKRKLTVILTRTNQITTIIQPHLLSN